MKDYPLNIYKTTHTFFASHIVHGDMRCNKMHGHTYTLTVEIGSFFAKNGIIIDPKEVDRIVNLVILRINGYFMITQKNIMNSSPYVPIAMQLGDATFIDVEDSTLLELSRYFYRKIKEQLTASDIYITAI